MAVRDGRFGSISWFGKVLATALVILLMATWGGSFLAIKVALRHLTPYELLLARFIPSALLMLPLLWLGRPSRGVWRSLSWSERAYVAGLAFFCVPAYHFCLNTGETMIPSSWAGLVIALNPAAIMLMAAAGLKETLTLRRITGVGLAFAGLIFIALTHEAPGEAAAGFHLGRTLLGMTITLGAVVSFGLFSVGSKKLLSKRPPADGLQIVTWVLILGTGWLLPGLRPGFFAKMAAAPGELWLAIGFLATGCTVAGYVIWYWILGRWPASRAGAFIYLVPLCSLIFGHFGLGEPFNLETAIGAAGVLGGVILAGR